MLHITLADGKEIGWHIGTGLVLDYHSDVVEVQADGDELAYILREFENLPYNKRSRVHRWFGDHAKLIAHNIKKLER